MIIINEISVYEKFTKIVKRSICNKGSALLMSAAIGLILLWATPIFADNAVKLRLLVITTGDETQDLGLAYIRPVLDEMQVPYDLLNASTQDLTASTLASLGGNACSVEEVGCVGNYNGIIVTNSELVPNFTPSEWDMLHEYQKNFQVRQTVLSGWPAIAFDPNPPFGVYLDYGLAFSSAGIAYDGQWTVPAADSKVIFEYVNQANSLPITDFTFAAIPRNDGTGLRDGTVPNVVPLLKTQNDEALVSVIRYMMPNETAPVREVMFSTITHAPFLLHSQVLAYEFVNWVTQGVFVGGRRVHMTAHLDDLFLANDLWDPELKATNPLHTYRLNSDDINNAVSKQAAFRAAHPTAGNTFQLDFPFNGAGAVVDPTAKQRNLVANMSEDLVAAVVANKSQFRYINHTFSHADMDTPPIPADAPCDYPTLTTVNAIKAEIGKNRKVWRLLDLPERGPNNRVLLTGNHSGLKDRKCTDIPELHLGMSNVQDDDVPFEAGANPLFLQAAAQKNVRYIASDASQLNQNVEQYITGVDDGSSSDRMMLPRYPTNIFVNVIDPDQLVDEYNHIFHDRFILAGENPCIIPGAICTPRDYSQILVAEANIALRHMLSFKKWPHFFHQSNLHKYNADGNTLQFDWLKAVYTEYENLFTLPVKNYPYYLIGDKTKYSLDAKTATIDATWDRTTNRVTLSANKLVRRLLVTGLARGELYGGQRIREINVNTNPKRIRVDQALTQ